jgi:hypothetical protein
VCAARAAITSTPRSQVAALDATELREGVGAVRLDHSLGVAMRAVKRLVGSPPCLRGVEVLRQPGEWGTTRLQGTGRLGRGMM